SGRRLTQRPRRCLVSRLEEDPWCRGPGQRRSPGGEVVRQRGDFLRAVTGELAEEHAQRIRGREGGGLTVVHDLPRPAQHARVNDFECREATLRENRRDRIHGSPALAKGEQDEASRGGEWHESELGFQDGGESSLG